MSAFSSLPSYLSDGQIWAKSIVFSNQPKHYSTFADELASFIYERDDKHRRKEKGIINYSQFYEACSPEIKSNLIPPADIRTGDILQVNSETRGVGAHYAVWLHKDLVHHDLSGTRFTSSKSPEEQTSKKRNRESEPPLDPFSWGLDESELKQLKKIVTNESYDDNYEESQEQLKSFLLPNHPQLFDVFQTEECLKYEAALGCLRFPDDHNEAVDEDDEGGEEQDEGGDEDEDEDEDKYLNDYNMTPDASSHFRPPIAPAPYPRMLRRSTLSSLCTHPLLALYLFPHVDEYGYCVPPSMSMAGFGYFPWEYNARHIDLALLPPPLDQGTVYGRKLNFIIDRINSKAQKKSAAGEDEEEQEKDGGNDEDEEDENQDKDEDKDEDEDDGDEQRMKTVKKDKVLAEVDFEGEDAITYWDIKRTFGREPSVLATREIFAAHAEKMREAIKSRGVGDGSTEEEVDEVLKEIMGL